MATATTAMSERATLIVVTLICLLTGGAEAVLPPDEIEAEKAAATHQLTLQLEAAEVEESSSTNGLDMGRATGLVVEVLRVPRAGPSANVRAGDIISFRVPVWAWEERDREPPGPDRLYWGPGAPRVRLEVWGSFRGDEFVASVFETNDAVDSHGTSDTSGSATETLDRIERIAAAFVATPDHKLRAELEHATGLRFESSGSEGDALRADTPASDGWAVAATCRRAGDARILSIFLGGATCVRRSDVSARLGADAQPIPVSPHRSLPAQWYLKYARPWGSILFGFRMSQPHDYDDCLTEVDFSHES